MMLPRKVSVQPLKILPDGAQILPTLLDTRLGGSIIFVKILPIYTSFLSVYHAIGFELFLLFL